LTFTGETLVSQEITTSIAEVYSMAKKTANLKIKLVSSAGTGHYYVTKKNPRTKTDKLLKKKYDPVAKKHVEYREGKIK
jgi:large subunit ribosomal protein L33